MVRILYSYILELFVALFCLQFVVCTSSESIVWCNATLLDSMLLSLSSSSSSSPSPSLTQETILACTLPESRGSLKVIRLNDDTHNGFLSSTTTRTSPTPTTSFTNSAQLQVNSGIFLFRLPCQISDYSETVSPRVADDDDDDDDGAITTIIQQQQQQQQWKTNDDDDGDNGIPNWDTKVILELCDNSSLYNNNNNQNYWTSISNDDNESDDSHRKKNILVEIATIIGANVKDDDGSKNVAAFEKQLKDDRYVVISMTCSPHEQEILSQPKRLLGRPARQVSSNATVTNEDDDTSRANKDDDDDNEDDMLVTYLVIAVVVFLGAWVLVTLYRQREMARWQEYQTHQLLQAQDEAFDVTSDDEDDDHETFDLELVEQS